MPWHHATDLVSRLASDDVVLTLVKDGDHRLSRPEDIERLTAAVEGLIDGDVLALAPGAVMPERRRAHRDKSDSAGQGRAPA